MRYKRSIELVLTLAFSCGFSLILMMHSGAFAQTVGGETSGAGQGGSGIVRLDPALDAIVPPNAKLERLAGDSALGFGIAEGPVWISKGNFLVFSNIRANVIDKWDPATRKLSVYIDHSGYTRGDAPGGINIGSNGITLDREGRLVYCTQGDRTIVRIEKDGKRTVLASEFEGKRLNSPNDLVYKSDGALYFTDPTGGLRGHEKDQQLDFKGVFLLKDGKLQAVVKDQMAPNGLAFSPDEKYLYENTSPKQIWRFDVEKDDTLTNGKVFVDMNSDNAPGGPDGMKVDKKGNLYSAGPGGLWIMSPDGKHIGTILFPERVTNMAFGDADAKTLYVTAQMGLYRIRLKIPGIRPS